jgi:preprotein translocase subunit YajC
MFPDAFSSLRFFALAEPRGPAGPLEILVTYLPMLLIVLAAWILLYRPEREKQRRQQQLLAALKKNDRVITTSGIYGMVANVDRDADRVTIKIDESTNSKLTVTLASIARVTDAPEPSGPS